MISLSALGFQLVSNIYEWKINYGNTYELTQQLRLSWMLQYDVAAAKLCIITYRTNANN